MATMEHATLEIEDRLFEVVSLAGEERLSQLFRYEVHCAASGAGARARDLLGRPAKVILRDGWGAERSITGIVAEARRTAADDGGAALSVVVRPAAHPLTLGRNCRAFQDVSLPDIVKKVLAAANVEASFFLTDPHPPQPYRAQYQEDDWAFVCRLLEEEGIYFWFDHEDGSRLSLRDSSATAPDLAGGARIDFLPDSELRAQRETVFELGPQLRAAPSRFSVASFDPQRPKLAIQGAAGDGELEVYDSPGGATRSPDASARRAALLRERAACEGKTVSGRSSSVRLAPGRVVRIANHPTLENGGLHLVVASSCAVTQRRRGAAADSTAADSTTPHSPYVCRFEALAGAAAYRPPAAPRPPRQAGLQTGAVVGAAGQEVFPDASGRVRVQLHWDREGARDADAGTWMRVTQRPTAGSMLLPRVGWNVTTFNDEGSVDAPTVLSRVVDAEHPPPYALPETKTRVVLKTATTPGGGSFNEVHFEDGKGAEEMHFNASRDMSVLVNNDRSEEVKNDAKRAVGNNHDLGVTGTLVEAVALDQTVTIAGNEKLTVLGDRSRTVQGEEIETVGGKRSIHTGKSHTTVVEGGRQLSVGTALVEATLGPIAAQAGGMVRVLVGGAAVRVSASSILEDAGLVAVQTIGGLKLELAKKDVGVSSLGRHIETVSGSMTLTSKKAIKDKAAAESAWRAGADMYVEAPAVTIKADTQIFVVCGASFLRIDKHSVELRGPAFTVDGGTLEVTGGKVQLNEGS